MIRQEELKALVLQWLELDLDHTCSSVDLYTSIRIEHIGTRVTFTSKRAGQSAELGMAQLNQDGSINGFVLTNTTPVLGLIQYALEKAVNEN